MLGVILKQLVAREGIPEYIRDTFGKEMKNGYRPSQLSELVKMLKRTIPCMSEVFICIDAPDEPFPKHRPELLISLRDVVCQSPRAQVFLTGRSHVQEEIIGYPTEAGVVPVSPTTDEIREYILGEETG